MASEKLEIQASIDMLGRLPRQVEKGVRAASRQAAAVGYRRGLREIPLDQGILVGYSRWFVDGRRQPGVAKAWLGEDVLRQAGDWEQRFDDQGRRTGRRHRADVEFPAEEAERVVTDVVVPEMLKVYEGVAEREIQKAVARG